tara:strand:+ start:2212 stop:4197 length:1986 start_codon:yes stop_codon:yes gene_type:complete
MAAEKFIIEIRTQGFAQANKSLDKVAKSSRAFAREANKSAGAAAGFRRSMSRLRNSLLLYGFAMATIIQSTRQFIQASSGFENVKTRLTGLMGSTQRAERAFKNFNAVAATTPFSLQDVVEAGAQLKAFGADAEGMIKPVTDLAAFMGTTATEAANSLGRAFAGGAGAADILRERGILNLVKSFNNIDDLSKITLPEFREALENALIDPAAGIAGSTDRMSKTFTGAFSNMMDAVTRLAANIGETFMPALKSATIGLGQFASETDRFLTFVKNGRADFDIFGESIDDFGVKIEALTVKQLEAELASLNKQMADSKTPIEEAASATISFGENIKILRPAQDMAADGTIKISENFNAFNDILSKNGITILEGTNLFDGLKAKEDEFNTTQVATNVNAQVFEERIAAINAELERRRNINPDLENAQKTFKELLEDTTLSQLRQIEALELLIANNQEQLGSNEEVMAVLTMLKEKYDNLTGATKRSKEEAKANAQAKKEEEQQLLKTAAATTAIASGLQQIFQKGASAEQQFKAILSTFAQLVSMGVFGGTRGAASLGGSILQAFTGFIGHTGGLIGNNGIQRFATGGMVQGQDNVPILAQSGEFIMQRSAVNSIGLQNLAEMNNTGQGGGVTINIAGDMVGDEDHVRTKVLPAIREELRREANA